MPLSVRDRSAGRTTRASVSTAGRQGNGSSAAPRISADGRYVAFFSSATTFSPGGTPQDVFLRDRRAGTTTRVSVSSTGQPANQPSSEPDVSADGRYVTFTSDATNLGPAHNGEAKNVFIRDRRTGVATSIAPTGSGDQPLQYSLFQPTISDDGSTVVFTTKAPAMVPPDTAGYQILAHDNRR